MIDEEKKRHFIQEVEDIPDVFPKGKAGNIPVYCSYDKIIPLNQLKPNPQNPNTHSEDQIKLLATIIKKQGWRQPITVSIQSGYIVKGHGRLMAAYETGELFAPVDFQYYETREDEMADLLADNKIVELSKIDDEILEEVLRELQETDLDMVLTGYNEDEISEILNDQEEEEVEPLEQNTATEKYEVVVTCSSEADQIMVYEQLQGMKLAVSKKTTQML